jgi:hypothetical protein
VQCFLLLTAVQQYSHDNHGDLKTKASCGTSLR